MSLCVPEDHFSVCEVSRHEELTAPAQLERMVNNMDVQWAFRGLGNLGRDSWLLLQRGAGNGSESGGIVMLCIQSKKRKAEACMQSGKLGEEAGKMLDIQGVDSLMVYVTDQRNSFPSHHTCSILLASSQSIMSQHLVDPTTLSVPIWH